MFGERSKLKGWPLSVLSLKIAVLPYSDSLTEQPCSHGLCTQSWQAQPLCSCRHPWCHHRNGKRQFYSFRFTRHMYFILIQRALGDFAIFYSREILLQGSRRMGSTVLLVISWCAHVHVNTRAAGPGDQGYTESMPCSTQRHELQVLVMAVVGDTELPLWLCLCTERSTGVRRQYENPCSPFWLSFFLLAELDIYCILSDTCLWI